MPKRIAESTLNASTLDIINTIRANLGQEYKDTVPEISKTTDIPKVGDIIEGHPGFANDFMNALLNMVAKVIIDSKLFNNPFADLKKGLLTHGETVEEIYVNITKAREFSVDKAAARELKRTQADVRTAFHAINWRVQYPISITDTEFNQAFNSAEGVYSLVTKIIEMVYTSANYDEYLLFKYLIIKAVAKGKMAPVAFDSSDLHNAAKSFRGISNQLTFMGTDFNASGVHTFTPKDDQYIFMDSAFNAAYDVDVLASAFNMDKATFTGKLRLIDSFTTFDNDRFSVIRANGDMIEEVTQEELDLMANVKAVLVDREWFQIYDNHTRMTQSFLGSGEYWNYFYNIFKTVSSSPFANAVCFVDTAADIAAPASITGKIDAVATDKNKAYVVTIDLNTVASGMPNQNAVFTQTKDCATKKVAVQRYGCYIFPGSGISVTPEFTIGKDKYVAAAPIVSGTAKTGDTVTFNKT